MVHTFGKVMIYVHNPRMVADFWVEKVGFAEVAVQEYDGSVLSVELTPNPASGASIVLFDRAFVAQMSPELNLGTPSILFATEDAQAMRNRLIASGVTVGELVSMAGAHTFNFADPEGNYFAVQEERDG